ncbi:MAG TPA: alpha/beta fold hydrolase [Actinomycetota bacterium]|nr:alpha/beta fold hydrolase [Actinomycetota bacterium]
MIEQREFFVDGLRLTGGVATIEEPKASVILCHGLPSGYPDEPGDRGYPGFAEIVAEAGFRAWWFNFRGARDSQGEFTLGGWINDLHAVIREVTEDGLPVFAVGSSAGGAVALSVAAESTSVDGVATLAAPAVWRKGPNRSNETLIDHARRVGIIKRGSPRDEDSWWAEFETNRPEWAAALMAGRPLLVVHGTADEVVPPDHAQRIFDGATEPKVLVMLEGASHQLRREERAVEAVLSWLKEQVDALSRAALDSDG